MSDGDKGDLKSLRKLWYKKLKDEGFRDIEISKFGNELEYGPLMGRTSSPYSNKREYNAGRFDTKGYEYYHSISTFLAHNPFYPGRASLMWHRWILELYAEGMSIRKILKRWEQGLLPVPRERLHVPTIHEAIQTHLPTIQAWYEQYKIDTGE